MQRNFWRISRYLRTVHAFNQIRCFKQTSYCSSGAVEHDDESDHAGHQKTHFGFETVTEKEKEEKVYGVFHNVARKYDLMNDVMSGGIHRLWKDYFMYRMSPVTGTRLLDVAGGTGDIAFRFLEFIKNQSDEAEQITSSAADSDTAEVRETHVTVCDINKAMLEVGKEKAAERGYDKQCNITWLVGDAQQLPIPDEAFDVYSIVFGIRNVTHIDKVLSEAYRVLRPGGRFMCLEFSEVSNPLFRRIYDMYSFQVMPVMGQVIAGDWKSYQYLVESIRQFPPQEDFQEMIEDAGFCSVTYENLTCGIAAIHSGFKL